jgi:hypothetical protein
VLHILIESVNASAATSRSDLLAAHPSSRPRRTESLAAHVDFPEAAALASGGPAEHRIAAFPTREGPGTV